MQQTEADTAMSSRLSLGSGSNTSPHQWDVDIRDGPGIDQTIDLDDQPWDLPSNHFEIIVAEHVLEHLTNLEGALRECARILRPGGQLVVSWPMGLNERADPDHESTHWVWDTPLYYCGERGWDADVGLTVIDRDIEIHTHFDGIVGAGYRLAIELYRRRYGDGRWLFDLPVTSGEFTVTFECRGRSHDGE